MRLSWRCRKFFFFFRTVTTLAFSTTILFIFIKSWIYSITFRSAAKTYYLDSLVRNYWYTIYQRTVAVLILIHLTWESSFCIWWSTQLLHHKIFSNGVYVWPSSVFVAFHSGLKAIVSDFAVAPTLVSSLILISISFSIYKFFKP